jgi:hypothetical protein
MIEGRLGGGPMLFVSPILFVIIWIVPSILFGVINGFFINLFWSYATRSNRNLAAVSIILGPSWALLPTLNVFIGKLSESPRYYEPGDSKWGNVVIVFVVASIACTVTNLITISLLKLGLSRDILAATQSS